MHAEGERVHEAAHPEREGDALTHAGPDLAGFVPVPAPRAGAEAPHPVVAIAARARDRMAARPAAFAWTYTEPDLRLIHKRGTELGLTDRMIEDMIFIGSRADKPLTAGQLAVQMTNWSVLVSKRGFPFRFAELRTYQRFSNMLLRLVGEAGLPVNDVRIQGSALRKTEAGDVDVGIFVAQAMFDAILGGAFVGKAKRTAAPVPPDLPALAARPGADQPLAVDSLGHPALLALAADVRLNPALYNAVAKTWAHAMLEGIVNSKSQALPRLKRAAKDIQANFAEQNLETLAMLIAGGPFDLDPSMRVVATEGVGE